MTAITDMTASTTNEPLELARRLHDTVAQRLAGLSYLLAAPRPTRDEALDRCRAEVDAALNELREALSSVGSPIPRDVRLEALAELAALRARCPRVELDFPLEEALAIYPSSLVGAFLVEALRNVRKHADPNRVNVEIVRDHEVVSITVANDGAGGRRGPSCGAGRRLLEVHASLHGALVESMPSAHNWWCQRLILPAT